MYMRTLLSGEGTARRKGGGGAGRETETHKPVLATSHFERQTECAIRKKKKVFRWLQKMRQIASDVDQIEI
jgi:hypothetical protein